MPASFDADDQVEGCSSGGSRGLGLTGVPHHVDGRGVLGVVEDSMLPGGHIARVYVIRNVPAGEKRGVHGHRRLEQLLVCLVGKIRARVHDGTSWHQFELTGGDAGLYVPPMHWRELDQFSGDAVCMVVASRNYEADDYIYDFAEFERLIRSQWIRP